MFRNAALGPHHDATPGQHLGTVPGQHPGAAAEQYPGAASSQPCPRARSTPAPHQAHNDPTPYQVQPPFRIEPITSQHCLGALPGAQKQKIGPNCNFFAIGNCCKLPNRESQHKTQQKWHISSLKEPRRAPNRKKVAKIPSFLFFAMGPIAATGQITRKRAEHHDQQPEIRNKKGARHADASEKPIWLESTLPWHHTARNKHRVQPSTYRRSPLRPELRGCTGAR